MPQLKRGAEHLDDVTCNNSPRKERQHPGQGACNSVADVQAGPWEAARAAISSPDVAAASPADQEPPSNPPAAQAQPRAASQRPDWTAAVNDVLRTLPRLNQEYKLEMQALLRACQVAGRVAKHSFPVPGASLPALLLDPAAKSVLQRQVLGNCNQKHAACQAAFRLAAQAAAAAAASSAPQQSRAAWAAVQVAEAFGEASDPAAETPAAAAAAREAVTEALQQLRAAYDAELVAATSALFAMCRGFGTLPPVSQGNLQIKQALSAAQAQHLRVEQLWQDLMLAAS